VGDQEHYYLNRIQEHVTQSDSREQLQDFLTQTTDPTFVLIQDVDIETSAFFTDHEQLLPLPIPDDLDKWIAIYHYDLPDNFPLSTEQ
jgi:hypothetical protein